MSRIDEIKERFNRWEISTSIDGEKAYEDVVDNATKDIRYLLSKLEIAEKALEQAKEKSSSNISKLKNGEELDLDEERNLFLDLSEALQQLRS